MERPASKAAPEPPRSVSLQRTGEVEVLKPLARIEVRNGLRAFRPNQPLWFRRVLLAGSVGLVAIGLVLVSAILVGINESAEIATNENPDYEIAQTELYSFDLSVPITFVTPAEEKIRSITRRKSIRSTPQYISKRRPQLRPPLQPEEPDFIPTTLVIYAENGVITSRIEPWLQSANRKPLTSTN